MNRVPNGFAPLPTRGPFVDINGPFYHDGANRFGFMPEERHCNLLGFAHGGILATLLDSAMAHCVVATHRYAIVTDDLSVRYKSVVARDRWAEVVVTLGERQAEHIGATAVLRSRGAVCAEGTGRFKLLLSRPLSSAGRQAAP